MRSLLETRWVNVLIVLTAAQESRDACCPILRCPLNLIVAALPDILGQATRVAQSSKAIDAEDV